ncbi:hypothetical protein F5Y16DRAFT_401103 [Xylariaceae sp. FL0255]|nr:hypothetical protein F5Y16DRAFT_401103 [Xylariaceae sp. FL0255]
MDPVFYSQIYGAITEAISSVSPNTIFVGGCFEQADELFTTVAQFEAAREQLALNMKIPLDEVGTVDPNGVTTVVPVYVIPEEYWLWSGGVYAYVFSNLAAMGIAGVGESQLCGFTTQVLHLIQQSFAAGDLMISTTRDETILHVQACNTTVGPKMLLVNKQNYIVTAEVPADFVSATAAIIDLTSGADSAWRSETVNSTTTIDVPEWAVVVLTAASS